MTIRSDMLDAAARTGPDAQAAAYLRSHRSPTGGYLGRAEKPDLYYTAFALEALRAIGQLDDDPATRTWLRSFGPGDSLDLIHASCLARCWASLGLARLAPADRLGLIEHLAGFASDDGGFAFSPGASAAEVFATFFATAALQDLDAPPPTDPRAIARLARPDGSFPNVAGLGATLPSTAAAAVLLCELGQPPDKSAEWIAARQLPYGGFAASPDLRRADVLSSAVALHALARLGQPLTNAQADRACTFVASLARPDGSYQPAPDDSTSDCEYLFYGLLARGELTAP